MLSFYDWMQERYTMKRGAGQRPAWKDNRFGDLAGDMFQDKTFPRSTCEGREVIQYLEGRGASWEAVATAKDALRIYRARTKS